jgi:hypothetical protein
MSDPSTKDNTTSQTENISQQSLNGTTSVLVSNLQQNGSTTTLGSLDPALPTSFFQSDIATSGEQATTMRSQIPTSEPEAKLSALSMLMQFLQLIKFL